MSDMPHSEAIFITQIFGACALCTVLYQISSISTHSSHIYLWHSPTLYQIFLLFHLFDILLCIHLPLPLHYLLFRTFFPIVFIFLSHALRGSLVIIIFFGLRMSFHRRTGRDRVGGSGGQAQVPVSRTMWLCSRERPYWRRTSGDTVCALANITITQRKTHVQVFTNQRLQINKLKKQKIFESTDSIEFYE